MSRGVLYLVPTLLGEGDPERVLPQYNLRIIRTLRHFIVEEEKTARRFIKLASPDTVIRECELFPLNEHISENDINGYLDPIDKGFDMGLLSEAGCPCVADPGSLIVSLAHRKGITVRPLVGPSSILLALMASGFPGQRFTFHGYLPAKPDERRKTVHELEKRSRISDETQIFIETPYRNDQLIDDLVKSCSAQTRLCVAADISTDNEIVTSATIGDWKKISYRPGKRPAIFLLSHR